MTLQTNLGNIRQLCLFICHILHLLIQGQRLMHVGLNREAQGFQKGFHLTELVGYGTGVHPESKFGKA